MYDSMVTVLSSVRFDCHSVYLIYYLWTQCLFNVWFDGHSVYLSYGFMDTVFFLMSGFMDTVFI